MRRLTIYTMVFAALACASALKADTTLPEPHKTIFFDLKLYNCDAAKGREINKRLRDKLSALPNLEIMKDAGACSSEKCAESMLKAKDAHRAIYGFVSLKTDIEKKRMGDAGADRYIIKADKHETYTISFKLIDAESGKMAEVAMEAKPEELNRKIDEMAASLAKFFTPREVAVKTQEPLPVPVKPEPALEKAPEIVKNEVKEEIKPEPQPEVKKEKKKPTDYEAAAYFSFILPTGDFADVAGFAFGSIIEGRRKNIYMENTELRAGLGYYYLSSPANDVTSYSAAVCFVSGGYRFGNILLNNLTITPLFTLGYEMHILENKNYSGTKTYLDPFVSVKCGADYFINDRFSVTGALGYSVFFESGSTGMYPVIDLGVKYNF